MDDKKTITDTDESPQSGVSDLSITNLRIGDLFVIQGCIFCIERLDDQLHAKFLGFYKPLTPFEKLVRWLMFK